MSHFNKFPFYDLLFISFAIVFIGYCCHLSFVIIIMWHCYFFIIISYHCPYLYLPYVVIFIICHFYRLVFLSIVIDNIYKYTNLLLLSFVIIIICYYYHIIIYFTFIIVVIFHCYKLHVDTIGITYTKSIKHMYHYQIKTPPILRGLPCLL